MAITFTRPIYDKKYAPLKRISWPWRILATYTSFLTWLVSTPWLAVRAVAPTNYQDNLDDIEHSWLSFLTPAVNFAQDTTYTVFSFADSTLDWALTTASSLYNKYLAGFEKTFEKVLANVETRVAILKNEGLNGITKAVSFDVSAPISTKLS